VEFDARAFNKAKLEHRMEAVPVPELSEFFQLGDEEKTPTWIVRGLSGDEFARASDSSRRAETALSLAQSLAGGGAEIGEHLSNLLGYGPETNPEFTKRVEILKAGAVSPTVDHGTVVRLGKFYPMTLWRLTGKILELSGQGALSKVKPPPSGNAET
jgi:hypothetical protein